MPVQRIFLLIVQLLITAALNGQSGTEDFRSIEVDTNLLKKKTLEGEHLYYSYPDSAKIIWEKILELNRTFSKTNAARKKVVQWPESFLYFYFVC